MSPFCFLNYYLCSEQMIKEWITIGNGMNKWTKAVGALGCFRDLKTSDSERQVAENRKLLDQLPKEPGWWRHQSRARLQSRSPGRWWIFQDVSSVGRDSCLLRGKGSLCLRRLRADKLRWSRDAHRLSLFLPPGLPFWWSPSLLEGVPDALSLSHWQSRGGPGDQRPGSLHGEMEGDARSEMGVGKKTALTHGRVQDPHWPHPSECQALCSAVWRGPGRELFLPAQSLLINLVQ